MLKNKTTRIKYVTIKYLKYQANGGLIQLVQIRNKSTKELIKEFKKISETDFRDLMLEHARMWSIRRNYIVDILF